MGSPFAIFVPFFWAVPYIQDYLRPLWIFLSSCPQSPVLFLNTVHQRYHQNNKHKRRCQPSIAHGALLINIPITHLSGQEIKHTAAGLQNTSRYTQRQDTSPSFSYVHMLVCRFPVPLPPRRQHAAPRTAGDREREGPPNSSEREHLFC